MIKSVVALRILLPKRSILHGNQERMSFVLEKSVGELKTGMVLAKTVYCYTSQSLLLKEGSVLSEGMIATLKTRNIFSVWIAEPYTLMIDPREAIADELKKLLLKRITTFAPGKPEANTSDEMVNISKRAKKVALRIVENPEIVNLCMEMKLMNSKLLYHHGVNTCALALLVSGVMTFGEANMEVIGTAALLHDLGCCEMVHLIGNKQRTPHEELLWQEHPRYGYHRAKERMFREEICEIILHHHENWDGSGYPGKLPGDKIPMGACIISVCEKYDRLIRQENYQNYQAIEYIYGTGGIYLNPAVVNAMCDNLAVYPLGSLVRLSTDEVGVVSNVRKNKGPRPVVRVCFNKLNKPYTHPKEVDLGKELTVFIKEIL